MIIESPWLKDIFEEERQKARELGLEEGRQETRQELVVRQLNRRFSEVSEETVAAIRNVHDEPRLDELFDLAADCPDLESFERQLRSS